MERVRKMRLRERRKMTLGKDERELDAQEKGEQVGMEKGVGDRKRQWKLMDNGRKMRLGGGKQGWEKTRGSWMLRRENK